MLITRRWLTMNGCTIEEIDWAMAQGTMDPERLAMLAEQDRPEFVLFLEFCGVPIDAARRDRCAMRRPKEALEYVSGWLSAVRLEDCAKQNPVMALMCASKAMPPELLDWCAREYPLTALGYAEKRLSQETKEWCKNRRKD